MDKELESKLFLTGSLSANFMTLKKGSNVTSCSCGDGAKPDKWGVCSCPEGHLMDTDGNCLACASIESTYLFSWHDSTTCYCQPYAQLNSDGQCVCAEGYVQTSNLECVPCDALQVL